MGKIAIWILIALAVMLVLRLIAANKRRVDDASSKGQDGSRRSQQAGERDAERHDGGELMMSCTVCGIHIPASDAVFSRGKIFCSAEHRDLAGRDDA